MVVSQGKSPSAQETFLQMAQAAGLRSRLLVTVGLLILVRLGIYIPVPGIDRVAFSEFVSGGGAGGVLGFLDIIGGGGLSLVGIFALGILPFINASIIMQLLTAAIPALEDLQKNEGEAGRRKISQVTRYVAFGWTIVQSTMLSCFILRPYAYDFGIPFVVETVLALTAGSMFVMWVGELITERGLGNGASLLIFLNIVSSLPRVLGETVDLAQTGDRGTIGGIVILFLVFIATIVGIVFVQEGTRRIPIVSARRQVGRKLYLEKSNYLPLRLNQGGVMPIIFASSMLIIPLTLVQYINNPAFSNFMGRNFSPTSPLYIFVYLVMIVFFSYFYASLVVDPEDMSRNLKKMGASIPGIRPGRATTNYISKVLNRLTFLGAIFLGSVAVVPSLVESATRVQTFQGFGATSLLILVGVAIDTAKQIQTYVISQRYEGHGEKLMTRLIFLGPPGAGKGTQAKLLSKSCEVPHISTGDILRGAVKSETALGKKAEAYMNAGELVPDELILDLIRERLGQEDTVNGWLLDGFPRNVEQAEFLDKLLAEIKQTYDCVINLEVPDDVLVSRMLDRGRVDDEEAVIRNRLDVYREQTEPLISFYSVQEQLKSVDGNQSMDTVSRALQQAIKGDDRD